MNRQIIPNHRYETDDDAYVIVSVHGTPEWDVLKNGKIYRTFTSFTAAEGWLEHVLDHPSSDIRALRAAAPALAQLLREQGIIK